MPLKKLSYPSLQPLIERELSAAEDESTLALIRALRMARARGHLTRPELERACRWKSSRAIHHVRSNSVQAVRRATGTALSTRDERRRLEALLSLKGVSIPTASAILTLLFPTRYGVIDIRVWQILHEVGSVTTKPRGRGFGFDDWHEFLTIVRDAARQHGVTARDVERALFRAHMRHQTGRLYDAPVQVAPDRNQGLQRRILVRAMKPGFSDAVLNAIHEGKILGIRAGTQPHRVIGIWAVVVERRVFVRSWSLEPRSWYRTFLEDPRGSVFVDNQEIPVRSVQTRSERLKDAVDKAYLAKYKTPGSIKYARDLGRAKSRATTTELVPLR